MHQRLRQSRDETLRIGQITASNKKPSSAWNENAFDTLLWVALRETGKNMRRTTLHHITTQHF
jgi:hypothetical protein